MATSQTPSTAADPAWTVVSDPADPATLGQSSHEPPPEDGIPAPTPTPSTAPAITPPRWSGKKTAVAAALAIGLSSVGAVAAAAGLQQGTGGAVDGRGGPGRQGGFPGQGQFPGGGQLPGQGPGQLPGQGQPQGRLGTGSQQGPGQGQLQQGSGAQPPRQ
jgi:hypothetical protein